MDLLSQCCKESSIPPAAGKLSLQRKLENPLHGYAEEKCGDLRLNSLACAGAEAVKNESMLTQRSTANADPVPQRRLFFAIPMPGFIREKVGALDDGMPGYRAVANHKLHLTLRFFGVVDTAQTDAIIDQVGAWRPRRFLLHLEGVGCFPSPKRPQVLWAGLGRGHPHLFGLQKQIEDMAANQGFPLAHPRFIPHVTVARCADSSSEAVRQWLKRHQDFGSASFMVDRFVLYRSRQPGVGDYQVVSEFPLGA